MRANFVFNGMSRQQHLTLRRDTAFTKQGILEETRAKRERRERATKEKKAAKIIQRNVRSWMCSILLANHAIFSFQSIYDKSEETSGKSLEQLLWDYKFFLRVQRFVHNKDSFQRSCKQIILQEMNRVMNEGIFKEELLAAEHGLGLLAGFLFEEYASPPANENENESQWKERHLPLIDVFLETAILLKKKEEIFASPLNALFDYKMFGDEAFMSRMQSLYASPSACEVAAIMGNPEVPKVLLKGLTSLPQNAMYLSPTASAMDVLLSCEHDETSDVDKEGNKELVKALVEVVRKNLNTLDETSSAAVFGKLVRLMPFFLECSQETEEEELRRNWLKCLHLLTPKENNSRRMLNTFLDLSKPRVDKSTRANRYKHLSTYLFAADYGLRLLKKTAVNIAALHENSPQLNESSEPKSSALSDFDLLCSIVVWPLYEFLLICTEQRIEAAVVLSQLVNSPEFLRCLWRIFQYCHSDIFAHTNLNRDSLLNDVKLGKTVRFPSMKTPHEILSSVKGAGNSSSVFWDPYPAVTVLFFTLLGYFLDTTDFMDGLERRTVMDRNDIVILILALKGIVQQSHMYGIVRNYNGEAVAQTALALLTKLHAIDEIESYVHNPSVWIINMDLVKSFHYGSITKTQWSDIEFALKGPMSNDVDKDVKDNVQQSNVSNYHPEWLNSISWSRPDRIIRLLQSAPFTIPFEDRATVFSNFIRTNNDRSFVGSRQNIYVRRNSAFMDAFNHFAISPNSREMSGVRFRDADNNIEEGIGEGVYREFLAKVCTDAFAPEYGLFAQTESGEVYPNPFSHEATGESSHLRRIAFLGAMVGRSLQEGVLLDVPFALHFRNVILGRKNSINNLKFFDKQLYTQLMSLMKLSEEEIESLSLTFTYTSESVGRAREVDLGCGRDIAVTRSNCSSYIHFVADYKLNREGAQQNNAFLEGLGIFVNLNWLKLFDSKEIMELFGGKTSGFIDIADWRQHTEYHSAADERSDPVKYFWQVVESLSLEEQKKLLKFTTSMPRPPLLGFRSLNPHYKIQVLWESSTDRLPSAATCFSTIKLPPYKDFETARRKIKAAIEDSDNFAFS